MSWLKNLVGPAMGEIWKEVANELKAEFVDGGFWGRDSVNYSHQNWVITLDTYTSGGKKISPIACCTLSFARSVGGDSFDQGHEGEDIKKLL
jgi:hypothetical protein